MKNKFYRQLPTQIFFLPSTTSAIDWWDIYRSSTKPCLNRNPTDLIPSPREKQTHHPFFIYNGLTTLRITTIMEQYIRYNAEFRLAICKSCQTGISSIDPGRHFQRNHPETWQEHRKPLLTFLRGMILTPTEALHEPMAWREPIDGLKVNNGWGCGEDDCTYYTTSKKHIENHCPEKHGTDAFKQKKWFECHVQTLLGNPYIKYLDMRISVNKILDIFPLCSLKHGCKVRLH